MSEGSSLHHLGFCLNECKLSLFNYINKTKDVEWLQVGEQSYYNIQFVSKQSLVSFN